MDGRKTRWRSYGLALLLLLAFAGLILRLSTIQLNSTRIASTVQPSLVEGAEKQHTQEMIVESGRGSILDRRGKPLTGERGWRLIAFPFAKSHLLAHEEKLIRLAEIIGVPHRLLVEKLSALKSPGAIDREGGSDLMLTDSQVREIEALDIPGIYAMESDDRLDPDAPARQLIGRTERNPFLLRRWYGEELRRGEVDAHSQVGVTGLEAAFDSFLRGSGEHVLTYVVDGKGRPLNGLDVHRKETRGGSGKEPHSLVTALDREVQGMVERILEEEGVSEAAVVVQEISSGDILAMASRPLPGKGREEQQPWDNRAIMETVPGSIFKTVVAVAALDTGKVKPGEIFVCEGELGRYGLTDSHGKGHGKQTFAEAYANSCNIVFAQVAERLGGETIEAYAEKLGLGRPVLWSGRLSGKEFRHLPGEQSGLIFAEGTPKQDGGAVAQTAIGQRDVRMTPVQAANMVTSLFHQGKLPSPRVVREIRNGRGKAVVRFPVKRLPVDRPVQPKVLEQVRGMMRKAVTDGTAAGLKGAEWALAGKTGTAQLGKDGGYNKWMVGFGPYEKPRYSVAVVIRSVSDDGDPRALRIFRKVMDGLKKMEMKRAEAACSGD
ncbi:Cell division protein FtsI/penicillin-binding protein 2 [Planifilum fulgidum]|uniref:Cell division protein FtsI/penicillin-binding protein 2 n=1 Tax=Planifilum fulgidum TaxID=201973 RepID=A0A1I2KAU7_9BACL|nr:penicillin-binding protein 2 [Planifilum fulgidum]SFF64175.1 Cell division protein FtsI/penicillin-binding protein 2 [Planifilum fulgidum]